MSEIHSPSTGRRYSIKRVCAVWQIPRSTVHSQLRRLSLTDLPVPGKRGPVGAATDEELVSLIRQVIDVSPFHGEGYRKIWARLRFQGVRTSKDRARRLMRENGLQARPGRRRGRRIHDGTITTENPDQMWGTDMTQTLTVEEGVASVFIAVDHCTCECVGIHAAKTANRFEALEPIRQGVREHFGAFEKSSAKGLSLRHDHGSQYVSDDFQNEIAFLGVQTSPSFVREPEGNGCAERFIRTLKENLLWVKHFSTVEELRLALRAFRDTYNHQWLIERHDYKTPEQARYNHSAAPRKAA
jgi:putative transposase